MLYIASANGRMYFIFQQLTFLALMISYSLQIKSYFSNIYLDTLLTSTASQAKK